MGIHYFGGDAGAGDVNEPRSYPVTHGFPRAGSLPLSRCLHYGRQYHRHFLSSPAGARELGALGVGGPRQHRALFQQGDCTGGDGVCCIFGVGYCRRSGLVYKLASHYRSRAGLQLGNWLTEHGANLYTDAHSSKLSERLFAVR